MFEAVFGGTVKTLEAFEADCRVEIGKIRSAGVMESGAEKYDAMRVTLYAAVYVLSMRLPRSNMIFCGSLNKER